MLALSALLLVNLNTGFAQPKALRDVQRKYGLNPREALFSRVTTTPDDVLKMFRDAGMSPTEHPLTKAEKAIIVNAFAALTPLHQRVLKQHLKSISFLDNMPNTALTSPVTKDDSINLYHITFRAGILHQKISEWATEKELTCYENKDTSYRVSIQAGLMSAFTYVLLHEGTHVVDGSVHLIATDTVTGKTLPGTFGEDLSKGIWANINTVAWPLKDSLVVKNRFRPGGRRFATSEATEVYQALGNTPFVSLYATASWHEDLAELVTVYHLTQQLNQPFKVVVVKDGKQTGQYEPMKNPLTDKRKKLLSLFYQVKN
nr:hypothetical protein [Ferruginibacter sp. HRS2-29]